MIALFCLIYMSATFCIFSLNAQIYTTSCHDIQSESRLNLTLVVCERITGIEFVCECVVGVVEDTRPTAA